MMTLPLRLCYTVLLMSFYNTSALTSEFLLFPSMVQNVSFSLKDCPETLCVCLVTWAFARSPLKMPACPLRCHHLESGLSETALQLHFHTMHGLMESCIKPRSQSPCIFYFSIKLVSLLFLPCVCPSLFFPPPLSLSCLSYTWECFSFYKGVIACHSLNSKKILYKQCGVKGTFSMTVQTDLICTSCAPRKPDMSQFRSISTERQGTVTCALCLVKTVTTYLTHSEYESETTSVHADMI